MGYFPPKVTLRRVLTPVTSIILTSAVRLLFSLLSISIDPLITVKCVTVNWTQESFVWTVSPKLIGFTFITPFFCRGADQTGFHTHLFSDNLHPPLLEISKLCTREQVANVTPISGLEQVKVCLQTEMYSLMIQLTFIQEMHVFISNVSARKSEKAGGKSGKQENGGTTTWAWVTVDWILLPQLFCAASTDWSTFTERKLDNFSGVKWDL